MPTNQAYGLHLTAEVYVDGAVVFQCQDASGATVSDQPVRAEGDSSTSFVPTKSNPMFTTDPALLAAAPAMDAAQAGCADGSTPVDPTLTTARVQLLVAAQGDAPLLFNCTASDPTGLSGNVGFTC